MLNDQGEWEEVTEIVIPENITSLNTSFASFEHLVKMTLHENVTSVERGFLAGNNALESLTLSTCLYEDLASYFTPYQSYGKSQVPSTLKEFLFSPLI